MAGIPQPHEGIESLVKYSCFSPSQCNRALEFALVALVSFKLLVDCHCLQHYFNISTLVTINFFQTYKTIEEAEEEESNIERSCTVLARISV